jgi:multiple sugar transport system substrate-binding protein
MTVATLGVAALALGLTGCGSSDTSSSSASGSASAAADGDQVTINVWAWEPTLTEVAKAFEKENPNIKINITNAGTANEEYTALNNAISANSGAPDVAQIEYYAVPQFALSNALADLTTYGAGDYKDFFTTGTWNSVTMGGDSVYALPVDSGPVAMFYNADVFKKAGIEVPTTWDEYLAAGEKLKNLGSDYYMAADSGAPDVFEELVWAAGGKPFTVDGDNLKISLDTDKGTQTAIAMYQKLIDNKILDTTNGMWSDEWWRSLADGKVATILTGAWMPAMLQDGLKDGSGQWRVATLPQFDSSDPGTGENGGSSLAIMASSDKAEAAYKFINYAAHEREGIDIRINLGQFPADNETLNSADFLAKTSDYFGGQKINEVLLEAANSVRSGWQFLPYDAYARSIYGDSAGQAMLGKTSLKDGIKAWQDKLVQYGTEQGFTVNK